MKRGLCADDEGRTFSMLFCFRLEVVAIFCPSHVPLLLCWPEATWDFGDVFLFQNYQSFELSPPSFFARSAEKIFLGSLTISCRGGAGNTCETRSRLACRGGLALLFLVEEGRGTHANPEVGWRVEVAWPYYFLWRRCKRHMRSQRSAGA